MSVNHEKSAGCGFKPLAVTVADTRKLTGLGNTIVWALIKEGTLQSVSVGRRRLVLYHSIERLLDQPNLPSRPATIASPLRRQRQRAGAKQTRPRKRHVAASAELAQARPP